MLQQPDNIDRFSRVSIEPLSRLVDALVFSTGADMPRTIRPSRRNLGVLVKLPNDDRFSRDTANIRVANHWAAIFQMECKITFPLSWQ